MDLILNSEIVLEDSFQLFVQVVVYGMVFGIFLGLFIKATWWLWK